MAERNIAIAPDGDVVLAFEGDDGIISARIRASSAALRLASPVFRKMLGQRFSEGQQLAANRSVYIRLEDDLNSMIIVCRALHMQYSKLMGYLDPGNLIEVAKLADKYDCIEALTPLAEFWLNDHKCYKGAELRDYFVSAYLFRRPEQFSIIGDRLLGFTVAVIPNLQDETLLQEFFQPIIATINAKRTAVLDDMFAFVDATAAAVSASTSAFDVSCGLCCPSKLRFQDIYLRSLHAHCLEPHHFFGIGLCAIEPMLQAIHGFQLDFVGKDVNSKWKPCNGKCQEKQMEMSAEWKEKFEAKHWDISSTLPEFCLGCTLEGEVFKEDDCKH